MTQEIYPSLAYEDARTAIGWLERTFGLQPQLIVPGDGGAVAHAELRTPDGAVLMVLSTAASTRRDRSPRALGGTASSVYLVVADIDTAYARAVSAGAEVFNPLRDAGYGREFCCLDPEGHIWTLGTYRPEVAATVPPPPA